MIKKIERLGEAGKYNLILTDRYGNKITMLVGGNLDLYWLPENYAENKKFYIDQSDSFLFETFCELFANIRKNDDKYNPTMHGDEFYFISEDYHEDEANRLKITKEDNQFVIEFIKTKSTNMWGFRKGCVICFCNSGSRVPKVEQLFMLMFNELAYYSSNVELDQQM